jgi:hypothetical protein
MYTPEGGKEMALALYKPLKEILEIQDENPENWVFKDLLDMVDNPEQLQLAKEEQAAAEAKKPENSLFVDQGSLDGENGAAPAANGGKAGGTIVAPSDISNPLRKMMGDMQGAETKATQSI